MSVVSHHPKLILAFHWRSHRRVLNVAVALRGKSTGWARRDSHWWSGKGGTRRWFVGHHTLGAFHRGLSLDLRACHPDGTDRTWTLLNIKTGASTPRGRKRVSA